MAKDGDPKTILSKFLDWVREHGGRHMLYRGIADTAEERSASAAIARRLLDKGKNEGEFIRANQELIETVKMRGHGDHKKLQHDLDILAELQHYGAATCLMDFTRNPLIGLWFACWNSPSTKGRVLAINSVDYDRFVKINTSSMEKSIEKLLPSSEREGKLWVWEPKIQNERIIAQQSVFVFGDAKIQEPTQQLVFAFGGAEIQEPKYVRPEHVFFVENTKDILNELQKYGLSLKSLFCDFDGFARANEATQKYEADNYLDKAMDEHAREEHKLAIEYYDLALIAPENKSKSIHYHRGRANASLGVAARKAKADASKADAYYKQAIEDYNKSSDSKEMFLHRGIAKFQLSDHKGAIADYDRAIDLDSKYAIAYYNRGTAKSKWRDKEGAKADYDYTNAITDYDRAISINPQYAYAYNNRGIARKKSGNLPGAIADYDRAIEINPQYANAHYNRGIAKVPGDLPGAIADYDRAIEINPQFAKAFYNRGLIKRVQGDEKGATEDFQEAEKLDPSLKPPKKE